MAAILPNGYQLLELFYAAALSGAVIFPVNNRLAASEGVNTSSKHSPLVQTLSWLGGPLFGGWRHQAKPVFRECLAPCKKS